jgi:UDP-N-acetylglucosamine--N-acetylmuramyl-(pentapeptide) pyrophosphoryl-undecaprenol N-acetylglucosamine transferase
MKIMFTGGGTGGHFYPIIAITEAINKICKEKKLLVPELYYMADEPYDKRLLFDKGINYLQMPAGKLRRYFSIYNVTDLVKTFFGIIKSLWKIFKIYPDVIFGKGGYSSFPALVAAKILKIPVVIHESDSTPGKVNLWASKFAKNIAVSFPEAANYFPKEKTAYTGNPLRRDILNLNVSGAHEFLQIKDHIPTILILGGSQGARLINESILEILPELVENYQVIHQTGKNNFADVYKTAGVILAKNPKKERYKPFAYLNDLEMQMSASASSLIISRAGSTIFEISAWGIPSIIIPITDSNGDHQRKNAFNYARSGGAVVIEEINLTSHILLHEIVTIMSDSERLKKMKDGAKSFSRTDASEVIALKLLEIGLSHEI